MKKFEKISDVGYVSIANLFSSVFGAIFWLILAPLLAVQEYGQLNYDVSIPSTLAGISLLGLMYTVTTFTAKGNNKISSQANSLILVVSIVVSIPMFMIHWSLGLFLLSNNIFQMSLAYILGKKSYKEYSILMIGSRISQVVLSLVFYDLIGIYGVILGYAVSLMVFGYKFFFNINIKKPYFDEIKKYWKYTSFNFAINIANIFYFFVDKIIIGALFGFNILGLYAFSFQFISALSFLPSSLSAYLVPEEATKSKTKTVKILGIVFSVGLTLSAIFLIPIIINSFFSQFSEGILLAQILTISIIPATFTSIFSSQFLGEANSRPILFGMIIFVIVNFIGIFVLGSMYNLIGLAYSLILAHITQASYLLIASKFVKYS